MKSLITVFLACTILTGCNMVTRKVDQSEYNPNTNSYFMDTRTKLCFAVVAYNRMDTGGRASSGVTQSNVPCTTEVLALINK